jgi:long-chain acyl-CoA synthetase
MTGESDDAISAEELSAKGAAVDTALWEQRWSAVSPSDICTFIYTSGTTGPPKGCIISHGNYRAMLDMVNETSVIENEDVSYLYLPLAHSFALLIQLGSFDLGATLAYWERDPLKILPNLAEVKPTYFPSVPRIFEKIYTAANSGMEKEGGIKKKIFDWAIKVGSKMRETERAGRKPGFLLSRKYAFADEKVLSKIRNLFGGNLRLAVSGAAPINPEILRFFDAAGVLVLEGWGMTETSTAATISSPDDFKVGTIGKPFPGCEVKIADDGEILVKGPNVFQGYHKNEEATRETIVDGWLHTGDIGEIDSDGFIKITGRKKDIIITAGGKNITPANLEAEIKQHPLVSQAVVVGDRRPYLVALVTLDPEEAVSYAKEHDLPEDPEQLAGNADVRSSIEAHVEEMNQKFARVEQVKKIAILPRDLSQENGELTPTLKVKRAVVADKHQAEIEQLYA